MNTPDTEPRYLLSRNQFILLSIVTFGLYDLWWIFKSWRFFRDKEQSNIHSAIRTTFSFLYLIPLLLRIQRFAAETGYSRRFSPIGLYLGFWIVNLLSLLPEPLSYVSLLSFLPLLPPFDALNYAIRQSDGGLVVVQTSFNRRQRLLLIAGIACWLLAILGIIGEVLPEVPDANESLQPYQG